ncbi:lipoyl(octanoyl) transferase LipB [Marinigracilibium pacificum]|uniref:Octanoyltransferase n=1 Tax=Marinigracilibium pacificum TaxID=2729599 RepID=A0A848IZP1_9BACT|nr:lipoyl(octanoyl) transferase LipB [Marinigracilibium pacificum]NMM49757.1 lipoyl(octanoyl) transferase LipB [Marinigracilibium pacificum]
MNERINKQVQFLDWGLIDYQEAWDKQGELFNQTVDQKIQNRKVEESDQTETPNYLIFCQHPHVYTLGKSGKPENLLLDEEGLKQYEATYYKINRGGDITYHGPGQLVGYPILDLENFFTDIHKYMRFLEEAIIRTLADYGIKSGRIDGLTGVWLDHEEQKNPRKICAMGVKSSRWVTMHGFAFNVNADLSYFGHIIPCGIDDKAVTSLDKELGRKVDFEEVKDKVKGYLAEIFEFEMVYESQEK